MANTFQHISRVQREQLLRRASRLRSWSEISRRRRPAFSAVPDRERRLSKVATRLERYIAGIGRHGSTLPLIERATRRHVAGETSYGEWIEDLRWAGLPARIGHTRLNSRQAAERRYNLALAYPRNSASSSNNTDCQLGNHTFNPDGQK